VGARRLKARTAGEAPADEAPAIVPSAIAAVDEFRRPWGWASRASLSQAATTPALKVRAHHKS